MVNVTMRASLHEQFAADQVGGLGIQDQNFWDFAAFQA